MADIPTLESAQPYPDTFVPDALSDREPWKIVVFHNPGSTRARDAGRQIADLKLTFGRLVRTCECNQLDKDNEHALQEVLEPRTILAIAGGDGTVNKALQVLMKHFPEQKIPLLPLRTGKANDLAHMLDGVGKSPSQTILNGRLNEIYPIRVSMQNIEKGRDRQRFAASYAGFGATAVAAVALNRPEYRKSPWQDTAYTRWLHDRLAIGQTLLDPSPIVLEQDEGELDLFERTISNGPRMAEHALFPVSLAERRLFVADIPYRHRYQTMARWGGRLLLNRQPAISGSYLEIGDQLTFTTRELVTAQYDGEPDYILAETSVTISQSDTPFYALSPKGARSNNPSHKRN